MLRLRLDVVRVLGRQRFTDGFNRILDLGLRSVINLISKILKLLLRLLSGLLTGVACFDELAQTAIFIGMRFGILDH